MTQSKLLFILHRPILRAIDPATGQQVWEFEFPKPYGVGRFFLDQDRVIATMSKELYYFGAEAGEMLLCVQLGFAPDFGTLDADRRLFLGDRLGAFVCLSPEGTILWSMDSEGFLNKETVAYDGEKRELWRGKGPEGDSRNAAGIAIGSTLYQPDRLKFEGW
jgi:outer membrane protein assembly factor BamB